MTTSGPATDAPARSAGASKTGAVPPWLLKIHNTLTPKTLITLLITMIIVLAEVGYGAMGGFEKLAITLGTCVALELALSWFLLGRRANVQSAYISGMSLSLLVRPTGGIVWPFALGAALSIGSKYVLRYRGKHLWNPSNLGLSLLVLLAPNKVAMLSHELGNDVTVNAVIWIVGLMVVTRAKVLHITLTYAASFAAFAFLRSALVGTPVTAELAPLTGPMYQLLVFFMMTDPPTTVSTRKGRILVAVLIAALECVFRLANDFELPFAAIVAPAPPILALFVVGPIALAIDSKRRARSTTGGDAAAPAR